MAASHLGETDISIVPALRSFDTGSDWASTTADLGRFMDALSSSHAFKTGGLGQMYTAALVMRLVEEGFWNSISATWRVRIVGRVLCFQAIAARFYGYALAAGSIHPGSRPQFRFERSSLIVANMGRNRLLLGGLVRLRLADGHRHWQQSAPKPGIQVSRIV